jgi:hypothetical protein
MFQTITYRAHYIHIYVSGNRQTAYPQHSLTFVRGPELTLAGAKRYITRRWNPHPHK